MVIDYLADRPHACDLLLDQSLVHESGDYDGLVPDRCTRLIGPRYALLCPEFGELRDVALVARQRRELSNLIVSMGGVDTTDATSRVLAALRTAPLLPEMQICVIMGGRAPALEHVRAIARTMPRLTEVAVDVRDMALRMARADLAIGAGGSTTWERCCLGLPSIIVETADNQIGIAEAMVKVGAGIALGPLQSPRFATALHETVAETNNPTRLRALSKAASVICDGHGVRRVIPWIIT